jgi:hypothetical protein
MLDERGFLVLNALYLKKMAPVAHLSDVSGVAVGEVRPMVGRFVEQDWVLDLGGDLLIQPEGMAQVRTYYRDTTFDSSQRAEIVRRYERFEAINSQFIKHVTDWQQTDGDPRVQDRVIATVGRLVKLISEMTQLIPRYEGYIRRFERSVGTVDQGNSDFVCSPRVDSLHNIWFEFHEDFLTVLGRPRDT